jgi:hypothetical protein
LPGGPVRPPFELLTDYVRDAVDSRLQEAGLIG